MNAACPVMSATTVVILTGLQYHFEDCRLPMKLLRMQKQDIPSSKLNGNSTDYIGKRQAALESRAGNGHIKTHVLGPEMDQVLLCAGFCFVCWPN